MTTTKELLERIQTLEKGFSILSRHLEELEEWKVQHEKETQEELSERTDVQRLVDSFPKPPYQQKPYELPNILPNGMKLLRVNCMTCGQEVQPNTFHKCQPSNSVTIKCVYCGNSFKLGENHTCPPIPPSVPPAPGF